MGTIALMYHELERPNRPLCRRDAGYVRYVVNEADFVRQLDALVARGLAGVSAAQALQSGFGDERTVAITFDDGCASDLEVAAPHLADRGFCATSFVVTSWLGTRGFLTAAQLRELADLGVEIGSHSATHAFLTDLPDARLDAELATSRTALEQILGRAVVHLSCPGGRWNPRVARAAARAGYHTLWTSRLGLNGAASDPFALGRTAVVRGADPDAVVMATRGATRTQRLRQRSLDLAKRLVGNSTYLAVRERVLARRHDSEFED